MLTYFHSTEEASRHICPLGVGRWTYLGFQIESGSPRYFKGKEALVAGMSLRSNVTTSNRDNGNLLEVYA
jgi:hypothetical protein